MTRDFEDHFQRLQKDQDAVTLNAKVAHVRIRNLGPIRNLSTKFGNGLNCVVGDPASGKTIMKRLLAYAAGTLQEKPCEVTRGQKLGKATVKTRSTVPFGTHRRLPFIG